jgi:Putative auto-transporter adhesin, head GIN domain
MRKELLLLLPCALATCFLFSCKRNIIIGSGNETTSTRTTAGYNNIEVSAPVDVTIMVKEGAQPDLQLTGYENIMQYIKTDVEGNTLRIYSPEGVDFELGKKMKANITVPSLASLSMSGANDAIIHGMIVGKAFKLDVSGAGDIVIDNVTVSKLAADLSGAGKIEIKAGQVGQAAYDISGAGSINAFGLQSTEVEASVSGVGACDINTQQKLDAHISGAGHIRYKGHPAVTSETSGVGAVSDAN